MNDQPMSIERTLQDWMAADADHPFPDQAVDRILEATAHSRALPRWVAGLAETPLRYGGRTAIGISRQALVLVALAILGIVAAAAVLLVRSHPAEWPGFRGGSTRASAAERGPDGRPVVAWQYRANAGAGAAIAISDGVALVPTDDGVLTALAMGDGTVRWQVRAPAPLGGAFTSSGRVFVADGEGFLHAFSITTGERLWTSRSSYPSPTDLAAAGRDLIVGTRDGNIVAVDADTGVEDWRVLVSPGRRPVRGPAASDAVIVVATDDGFVTAVEVRSHAIRWQVRRDPALGIDELGTAALAADTAYVGMGPAARSGALVAYDVASGAMKWTLPERPYSPAIDAQMGYVATASGVVTAVDLSTGRSVWSSAFAPPLRPPAVAGGLVLVAADGERSLLALDASTGATLWRQPMDGPNPCCIAVADGLVLAGTTSGSVFAIGGDGAPVRPQVSESPARSTPVPASATASASPSPSQSITPAPGGLATTLLWAVDGGIATFNPWALSQAPDGRLWASEGNADRFSIFTTDGDFVESWGVSGAGPGEFRLRRANGDPFGQIAFAADGSFFVLDPGNRRVQRFDRQRRFVREWDGAGSRSTRFVDPVGIAVDSLGHVSVLDDGRGVIETFAADGTVLKTIPAFGTRASGVANSLAVGPGGHFFVASADPNEVLELDANGTLIRTFGAAGSGEGALNEQPFGLAFDVAGHLYVTQGPGRGDRPGVLVFDAQGAYLGGFGPVGAGIDQLGFPWGIVVADDGIYVADAGSQPDVGFASFIRKFSPIRLR